MKKLLMLFTALLLTVFLGACGGNDNRTNETGNDTTTNEQNADTADNANRNDQNATENNMNHTDDDVTDIDTNYNFTSFDLEVDIENNDDAIDVDYDKDTDKTEVSYKYKPDNINLKGNEAMEALDKIFAAFKFDENTSDDEVLNEVLKAFNVPDNATKIELEIEFANGVEKEYIR